MIARLLGHVNGLTILIAAVLAVFAVAGLWAFLAGWVMDRPEPRHAAARDEQDTLAWLMTIKYGPAWGALAVRDRLMFLRAIIAAAGGTFQASPAGPGTPAPSPSVADGAAPPGDGAAAGSVPAPQALPPLPPDELGPECSYQDGPSFTDWLRDDIAMEAAT